jgi:hypothetical protein
VDLGQGVPQCLIVGEPIGGIDALRGCRLRSQLVFATISRLQSTAEPIFDLLSGNTMPFGRVDQHEYRLLELLTSGG